MSLRRPAKHQPKNFEFSSTSLEAAKEIISKYKLDTIVHIGFFYIEVRIGMYGL